MTPYELRFDIFKEAECLAQNKYSAEFETAERWNSNPNNSVKMDYPEFPTFEYIQELANKINSFVSSK